MKNLDEYLKEQSRLCREHDYITSDLFHEHNVNRGLRDKNGIGVLTGLTSISKIQAYKEYLGHKVPCKGKLFYRGYNIVDLVKGPIAEERYGFEEMAYLLIFGELPTEEELKEFQQVVGRMRGLPTNFVRDVIMKAPGKDIMNTMTKSVLTLSSYDPNASDTSIKNVLRQCLMLISVFPMLAVYGYHAYNHYERDSSMYIHRPNPDLSTAENLLRMLRPDMKYTELEAHVLDIALMLHMEHGGGNNSTFTTRVNTSAGSDTYAVIAAALCALKGPKHGGANIKVVEMMQDLEETVKDITDKDKIRKYLEDIVDKKAFDEKGLIYGMGHAIYSVSDPRAEIFKGFVKKLAEAKGYDKVFAMYSAVEELAPQVIADKRKIYKGVSANVDFYSGLVYRMLDIPLELYTPIFAIARVVGWSAHRIEELINVDKIIRPSYLSVGEERIYKPIERRNVIELAGSDPSKYRLEEHFAHEEEE